VERERVNLLSFFFFFFWGVGFSGFFFGFSFFFLFVVCKYVYFFPRAFFVSKRGSCCAMMWNREEKGKKRKELVGRCFSKLFGGILAVNRFFGFGFLLDHSARFHFEQP
jgi:hypothetical protein